MESHDDDKAKAESSRIPSPSSISSIHSVRPLEWDSGADIGYLCKESSNLSTVERMALVRGTVNFLEACQPVRVADKLNSPLAHSSPFGATAHVYSIKSNKSEKEDIPERLVDYTVYSEESFTSPFNNMCGNCKSLDDLRHSPRKTDRLLTHRSLSSNSVLVTRKSSSHPSASSVATVKSNRNHSDKAVQVNETSLKTLSSTTSRSSATSGIYPLTSSSNNPTYTIDATGNRSRNTSDESYDAGRSRNTNTTNSRSYADSSDKGSFEYVPGSVYDIGHSRVRRNVNSDSDVNTLCSEVVDGVELVTRYVNNLRVSSKPKVVRKIVQTLMSNFDAALPSRQDAISNCNNNSKNGDQNRKKRMEESSTGSSSKILNTDNKTSVSDIPRTESGFSDRITCEEISRITSNVTTEQSDLQSHCRNGKYSESSTNVYPLKEFLAKERENQLLWIKSGIDHLNNLKRLYESQRRLRKNLHSLRKIRAEKTISTSCENDAPKLPSQSHKPLSGASADIENSSVDMRMKRNNKNRILETSSTLSTTSDQLASQTNRKIRSKNFVKTCKHECGFRGQRLNRVENKENISSNRLHSQVVDNVPESKPSICYTVLFDKKPSILTAQNFTVRREIIQKCTSKEYFHRNSTRRKSGNIISAVTPSFSLQDYLLQNKPDYVTKAELRRQCLEEIAKLRQLRDKSRDELLNALQNQTDKASRIVPPPLSVVRIFDDKSMKRQTAEKYQLLPEVQSKKLELKRKNSYRQNQIMAKVFTKRLQKKVLKGQVNLPNNANVISI